MSAKMDKILYNGEEYEIEAGLEASDVRASMSQVFSSILNAHIEKRSLEDGSAEWVITEKGGDKG